MTAGTDPPDDQRGIQEESGSSGTDEEPDRSSTAEPNTVEDDPDAGGDRTPDGDGLLTDEGDQPTDGHDPVADEEHADSGPTETPEAGEDDDSPSLAGILGAEEPDEEDAVRALRPIEPETPSLEGAVFVVLGVVISLLVVYRLITLF
jgi:hypothetical protein